MPESAQTSRRKEKKVDDALAKVPKITQLFRPISSSSTSSANPNTENVEIGETTSDREMDDSSVSHKSDDEIDGTVTESNLDTGTMAESTETGHGEDDSTGKLTQFPTDPGLWRIQEDQEVHSI